MKKHHRIFGSIIIFGLMFMSVLAQSASAPETSDDPSESTPQNALTYSQSAVLGVIEGLTEYLPVSSTGHLILADYFFDRSSDVTSNPAELDTSRAARNAYLIVIQGGAILAVLLIYWKKVLGILMGLLGRNPQGLALGLKVLVAFIPAALVGPFLNDLIEAKLFNPVSVCIALVLGAVVMIVVEKRRTPRDSSTDGHTTPSHKTMEDLSYREALMIGVAQCFAMWPGMSRSMVTIVGGYLAGLEARAAAEFSFLLGLVTLSAASCYSLLKSGSAIVEQINMGPALFGILVATVVAFLAVKWFVGFLTRHGMLVFAIYRLILAAAILWLCSM